MKIHIASLLLSNFLFFSCKKEYTCSCTYQGQEIDVSRGKYTKKDAQKECTRVQNESQWLVSPVVCELK